MQDVKFHVSGFKYCCQGFLYSPQVSLLGHPGEVGWSGGGGMVTMLVHLPNR